MAIKVVGASMLKWVSSGLKIIGVDSLRIGGGLQLWMIIGLRHNGFCL